MSLQVKFLSLVDVLLRVPPLFIIDELFRMRLGLPQDSYSYLVGFPPGTKNESFFISPDSSDISNFFNYDSQTYKLVFTLVLKVIVSCLVAEHLSAQHSAIKMLHSRVRLVLEYLRAVESGQLSRNHDILREAYALSHRLPVIQSPRFHADFYNQCNDVGLMTYLGTITKSCNDMNQLVNKFNLLYDRQGMGRRMRGIFF